MNFIILVKSTLKLLRTPVTFKMSTKRALVIEEENMEVVESIVQKSTKKPAVKKAKVDKTITEATQFVSPLKTIIVNGEWMCQNVPCLIISKTDENVQLKPFNKSRDYTVSMSDLNTHFVPLNRDNEYVYTEAYPGGCIKISEFSISPISISELTKHFESNKGFVGLLEKAYQDSYVGKGNTFCINMKKYNEYMENNQVSKLERIGDPIFNRTTRHTVPIAGTFTRDDYEKCPSFPAPIGIRAEDFALPSEQNDILCEMLTQIFNCVNAPKCPPELQARLKLEITPNTHTCEWCGDKMDIAELNQEYCSKEHSVNFCHRDPVVGTKKGNVYIGHCSCNREQGGYSEEQRIQQLIRLAKYNPIYREMILKELNI